MAKDDTQDPSELLKEWRAIPDGEVWVIDETKTPLSDKQKAQHPERHGELISFTVIRLSAAEAIALLDQANGTRKQLPVAQAAAFFKSGELIGAVEAYKTNGSQAELAAFANLIGKNLSSYRHVYQLLTTHHHIRQTPSTKMASVKASGSVVENTSKQLNVIRNVAHWLMTTWTPARGPIDVVIDRAQDLGLDPKQEGIQEGQFTMHRGKVHPADPFEVRIIAGSDTERTLCDLLLLPDLLGYLIRRSQQRGRAKNLDVAIDQVLSGTPPFLLLPYDIPALVAAADRS